MAEINLKSSLNPHLTQIVRMVLYIYISRTERFEVISSCSTQYFFNTLKIMINLTKSLIFNILFSLDTYNELQQMEIPATLVLDAAVG